MTDTEPASLRDQSSEESGYSHPSEGDTSTYVAIVGSGFTGLSTALHAVEKSVDCHVPEAQHIGYGGSGQNAGLVNAGFWLPAQDDRAKLGEGRGARLVDTLNNSPETEISLIEKHQTRSEATRNGIIHTAHSPTGFDDLERRAEEWRHLGEPVNFLSRDEAVDKIGSKAFLANSKASYITGEIIYVSGGRIGMNYTM